MTERNKEVETLLITTITEYVEANFGFQAGFITPSVPGVVDAVITKLDAEGWDVVKK